MCCVDENLLQGMIQVFSNKLMSNVSVVHESNKKGLAAHLHAHTTYLHTLFTMQQGDTPAIIGPSQVAVFSQVLTAQTTGG